MRQFSAIAASVANSTALRLRTGRAPGKPRHTGQTLVLGGAPNFVEHEQKILVTVSSWTCTSSPITGSYRERVSTGISGVVAINAHYIRTVVEPRHPGVPEPCGCTSDTRVTHHPPALLRGPQIFFQRDFKVHQLVPLI